MDDVHRRPRAGDRDRVRERIKQAVRSGRISDADAEIRLSNVDSAGSMLTLGLVAGDLDHPDPFTEPSPFGQPEPALPPRPTAPVRRSAAGVPVLAMVAVFAAAVAGMVGLFAVEGEQGPAVETSREQVVPGSAPTQENRPTQAATYRLDVPGITTFMDSYRAEFGTSEVVELTLYDDYAIVRVPVPGAARNTGWRYAEGGFDAFGAESRSFPGSAPIDLTEIDLTRLVRNIATARRTLDVEDYRLTYVRVAYRPGSETEPRARIYVTNEASESGYLTTTLAGEILDEVPFAG